MNTSDIKRDLITLYSNQSKHSNYQILPERLRKILQPDEISTVTRYEKERLNYVLDKVSVEDKSIIDIGANTGYFSFELLEAGAKTVHYFEGNKEHARFVSLAAEALELDDRLQITNDYFNFDGSHRKRYDIALLFNVLHHVGDDYGEAVSIDKTKQIILNQLDSMGHVADTLIFQLGFNWMGDSSKPLFANGTKQELIDFIANGSKKWSIASVGVAAGTKDRMKYEDLNEDNIKRDDALGEFLNRPIFILKLKES